MIVGSAYAQKAEVFVTNNPDEVGAIEVKWIYTYVYHPDGFNVYRKENGGSWQKLNSSPIKPITKLPSGHTLTEEEKGLFDAMTKTSYEELKESIVRAFALIKAIYNDDLAEYLGIYYTDKTAQQGKSYQYKVSLATSDEELAVSKEIECTSYKKISAPDEINFERKKNYIYCNWKPDLYRYFGVDVYRKNAEGGEYEKMTKTGPIALQPKDVKLYNEGSIFFVDTNIRLDDNYVYKLVAIDYFGDASEFSEEISVPAEDFIPPSTPFGFSLTPSSTKQTVYANWSSIDEEDLAGFNIYWGSNPQEEFKKANTQLIPKDQNSFLHEDVEVGGYYYIVASVDFAGNESYSGMMFTELVDRTPPAAPQGLKASAVSGEITLTWSANREGDLKGYFIQKSLSDSNNLDNNYINVNAEPLTVTSFTEKLPNNIKNEFVYRVVAVDTLLNRSKPSINSMAQMPDVVPPKQPVISNVRLDEGNIVVEWISNKDNDLQGYDLYRMIEADSSSSKKININTIPGSITAYNDRDIEEGKVYFYQLSAKDNSGNESLLSAGFKIKTPREKKELNIEVEKASFNKGKMQVTLQWNGPKDVQMRGYVIYMLDEYGTMKPISGLSEYTEYKTKLTSEEEYAEFEIRGYTLEGEVIKTDRIPINKTN